MRLNIFDFRAALVALLLFLTAAASMRAQRPGEGTGGGSGPGLEENKELYSSAKILREGVADDFRVGPEHIVPLPAKKTKISYPHLDKDFKADLSEPPPASDSKSDSKSAKKGDGEKTSAGEAQEGFFSSLWRRLRTDRTLTNAIVLVILIAVFAVYRIRAGKGRALR